MSVLLVSLTTWLLADAMAASRGRMTEEEERGVINIFIPENIKEGIFFISQTKNRTSYSKGGGGR